MYIVQVAEFLMDRGADLETRDSRNWTPLIYAAEGLNERIVKRLVRKHQ